MDPFHAMTIPNTNYNTDYHIFHAQNKNKNNFFFSLPLVLFYTSICLLNEFVPACWSVYVFWWRGLYMIPLLLLLFAYMICSGIHCFCYITTWPDSNNKPGNERSSAGEYNFSISRWIRVENSLCELQPSWTRKHVAIFLPVTQTLYYILPPIPPSTTQTCSASAIQLYRYAPMLSIFYVRERPAFLLFYVSSLSLSLSLFHSYSNIALNKGKNTWARLCWRIMREIIPCCWREREREREIYKNFIIFQL
jgi:hypothetical protein